MKYLKTLSVMVVLSVGSVSLHSRATAAPGGGDTGGGPITSQKWTGTDYIRDAKGKVIQTIVHCQPDGTNCPNADPE